MIRPDHESELHRFFSGALAAAMGIRSATGGMLDAARAGYTATNQDRVYDSDDKLLEAAWEYGRIEATLRTLSDADRRVLRMVYEPLSCGERDRLEIFGNNARVAVVIFGGDRARLVRLCHRAKDGRDAAVKREAMALLCGLVWQAATRTQRAQTAYSGAAEQRVYEARPWYVPQSRFGSRCL